MAIRASGSRGVNWSLSLSGLVATGQVSTKVGDLVAGKEYILALLTSAPSTTFAAGDPASLTFLGTQGISPFMDQTGLSTPAAGIVGGRVIYVQALFASATAIVSVNQDDDTPAGDTTQIVARQNGEVYTSHTNTGNNTNGIYLIYERQNAALPNLLAALQDVGLIAKSTTA